ncbi:NapC/NirT family cytochrome c [Azoarcus sp. DN11]|uniref:NapC/NirT family cytochrome c n=1 Tax=Azoarcus sp. DN11 TaxID=356837 RepID=UPI000EB2E42E|nr:NapC/NirT family cytochrome c [Azoarcus sp. DN11]AYH42381.1 butanol dehydrogenase [Azoarcus sp. DN11]
MKKTLTRIGAWLARRNPFVLIGVAVIATFAVVAGGSAAMEYTMTEAFCTSCHEMRNNVYAEYGGSIHDTNRTGVRAICPDCHVPREPVDKWIRKIQAAGELYQHFIVGKIDTKEKFREHRAELAKNVWTRMKSTDSRECRHCHTADKMSSDLQTETAQARHAKGREEGLTCIDCHFGIAHQEPKGIKPSDIVVKQSL